MRTGVKESLIEDALARLARADAGRGAGGQHAAGRHRRGGRCRRAPGHAGRRGARPCSTRSRACSPRRSRRPPRSAPPCRGATHVLRGGQVRRRARPGPQSGRPGGALLAHARPGDPPLPRGRGRAGRPAAATSSSTARPSAYDAAAGRCLPFAALQKRLGRKTVSPALLASTPVAFMAFDLLYQDGDGAARPPAGRAPRARWTRCSGRGRPRARARRAGAAAHAPSLATRRTAPRGSTRCSTPRARAATRA